MKAAAKENGMSIEILLVEDSPGDVRLTQEVFRDANSLIRLHVASDGVEAMAFLRREGLHMRAPRPDLVLLDVNLPDTSGLDVLRALKQIPETKSIPVVVTSADATEKLIRTMLAEGAVEYLTKPLDVARIFQVIDENLTTEPKVA